MIPVLRKEMRSVLRERRGWLVPVVYAACLGAAVYLFFADVSTGSSWDAPRIGQVFAGVVFVMQLIAVSIFAPLVGAAGIAGERERGTWSRLIASPIPRWRIGMEKALASWIYIFLLLSVSLPVASLSLLYGGADFGEIAGIYLTHAILGITFASIGLAVSTAFQRTWTAALVSIAITFGLVIFSFATWVPLSGDHGGRDEWSRVILYFNPGFSLGLFFEGDMNVGSRIDWFGHYGAMALIAALSLVIAIRKLTRTRE